MELYLFALCLHGVDRNSCTLQLHVRSFFVTSHQNTSAVCVRQRCLNNCPYFGCSHFRQKFEITAFNKCINTEVFRVFYARSQNCEKRLVASSCPSVCVSVCPSAWNNAYSHWTDFDEICYLGFSKICFENSSFI